MKLKEVLVAVVIAALPAKLMAEDILQIAGFGKDLSVVVAEGKGFFRAENIKIQFNGVTDSPGLFRNLISGKYDLILNNADNVIAWAEGQGEDPQKNDLVIFLGGSQGVGSSQGLLLKLLGGPGINEFGDLKGKILAVDAPTTGYAIVGLYILKKHDLELNRDYIFKSFGNTVARADALSRGDAAGAMMSLPDEEIQKRGFRVLASAEDYVKHYARGLGATRRAWANANEELLIRFIRAMIRATDWMMDVKNKEETIKLLLPESKNSRARAEGTYTLSTSPRFGSTPRAAIDSDGIRFIIELREVAGLMKPPVPKAEKYVDERFYKKALATLKP